jgi:hypothetical protein
MAGTTTNNGWDYPTSTDLLKDGALAIQTLATDIDTSVGTGLLAWTSYTPTFANFTLGNGTISFAYSQVGKVVNVRGIITLGTTSVMGTNPTISTPVTAFTASGGPPVGQCVLSDTGTGAYPSLITLNSTTTFLMYATNTAGTYALRTGLQSNVPFVWTSTDVIYIQATYQAA